MKNKKRKKLRVEVRCYSLTFASSCICAGIASKTRFRNHIGTASLLMPNNYYYYFQFFRYEMCVYYVELVMHAPLLHTPLSLTFASFIREKKRVSIAGVPRQHK